MQNGIIVGIIVSLIVGSAFVYFATQQSAPEPVVLLENSDTRTIPEETESEPQAEVKTETDKRSMQGLTISPKLAFSHALNGYGAETVYVYGIPDTIYKGMQSGVNYAQEFSLSQNGVRKYLLNGVIDVEQTQRADGSYPASVFFMNPNPNVQDKTIAPGLYTLDYEIFSMLPAGEFELKRVSEFKVSSKVFAWPPPTCKVSVIPATPYANEAFTLKWTSSNATGVKWIGNTGSATVGMELLGLNSDPLAISGVATKTIAMPEKIFLAMEAVNANGDLNTCSFSFSVIASTTTPTQPR